MQLICYWIQLQWVTQRVSQNECSSSKIIKCLSVLTTPPYDSPLNEVTFFYSYLVLAFKKLLQSLSMLNWSPCYTTTFLCSTKCCVNRISVFLNISFRILFSCGQLKNSMCRPERGKCKQMKQFIIEQYFVKRLPHQPAVDNSCHSSANETFPCFLWGKLWN